MGFLHSLQAASGSPTAQDSMDKVGRWILVRLDYRIVGILAIIILVAYLGVLKYRTKSFKAPLDDLFYLSVGVVTLFSSITLGCVFLLTKPPAVDLISGDVLVISGLASVIACGWVGARELYIKFFPPTLKDGQPPPGNPPPGQTPGRN